MISHLMNPPNIYIYPNIIYVAIVGWSSSHFASWHLDEGQQLLLARKLGSSLRSFNGLQGDAIVIMKPWLPETIRNLP